MKKIKSLKALIALSVAYTASYDYLLPRPKPEKHL